VLSSPRKRSEALTHDIKVGAEVFCWTEACGRVKLTDSSASSEVKKEYSYTVPVPHALIF